LLKKRSRRRGSRKRGARNEEEGLLKSFTNYDHSWKTQLHYTASPKTASNAVLSMSRYLYCSLMETFFRSFQCIDVGRDDSVDSAAAETNSSSTALSASSTAVAGLNNAAAGGISEC
jgi:hypothetical protein